MAKTRARLAIARIACRRGVLWQVMNIPPGARSDLAGARAMLRQPSAKVQDSESRLGTPMAHSTPASDTAEDLLRCAPAMSEPGIELADQFLGCLGDHRSWREDRFRPRFGERVVVLRRNHAADNNHNIVAALLGERSLEFGYQREMTGGQRRDPDDVHVVLDRLARSLRGRCEQRTDIDVEAEIGEGRGDHLLAAVVAVLAD